MNRGSIHLSSSLFTSLLLLIPAQGATKVATWSENANTQWWTDHSTPEQWQVEKKSIHQQLTALYNKAGIKKALDNKHFAAWTEHLLWLSLFPENWQQDDYFKSQQAQTTFRKIGLDEESKLMFLRNISPQDDLPKALKIFCKIYQAHPKEMEDYSALAAAISIVFDQPFPEGWPHAFVKKDSLPLGKDTPVERFAFYTKANKDNKLLLDITKMYPNDLKFLVDTPIELMELSRLQKIKIKTPRQLEQLFHVVRYDEPRLRSGRYMWSHGAYTMDTINKKGGLCVDQAYFTIHTAKAKGVPSIMFMGQGNSGAHAWVGAMKSYNTWGFDFAKFRNEDYPVGQSYDPQTWKRLTDSECKFLDTRKSSADLRAGTYLIWAYLNPASSVYLESLRAARKISPMLTLIWEMEAIAIAKENKKEQEKFWKSWIKNFDRQNDLCFRGQKRLLAHYQKHEDTEAYDELLKDVIRSNKSKREDLVVKISAENIFVLIEEKKWKEADKAFTKTMQYLRTKAGGALFYNLVQPYARTCLDAGKVDFAKSAIKRSLKVFSAQKGSILDRDVKQLSKLVDAK